MKIRIVNVALFDLDGTLCDYDKGLLDSLNALRSPHEPVLTSIPRKREPLWLKVRMDLVRANADWWVKLPKFKLGHDIWELAGLIGYQRMILSQGPRKNPLSWSGKKMWVDVNLGPDIDVTITRDKSLVYGKVLVDDYPPYIEAWLEWRPRGLVIMPASDSNADFIHPQVIRYDGTNFDEVKRAMEKAFRRSDDDGRTQNIQ